jgi:hypothetical protein
MARNSGFTAQIAVHALHDQLWDAAATVTIISPFYDAGLSIEYAVDGLAVHVPQLADLRLLIVPLNWYVLGRRLGIFHWISTRR